MVPDRDPVAGPAGERFVEPTTGYWQTLSPEETAGVVEGRDCPPFRFGFPVDLPSGERLVLPLRELPGGEEAVASLIANQASFAVVRALADAMAEAAGQFGAEVVVGLPTLGMAFAPLVAEALGFTRYVPLGYSRKYWYDDALSEPVASVTSPEAGKRIFLDPNQLPLLRGRRILVVDDAVSSGRTLVATARLLRSLGLDVAGVAVAMMQSRRWVPALAAIDPDLPSRVVGVFSCPRFRRVPGGWVPEEAAS